MSQWNRWVWFTLSILLLAACGAREATPSVDVPPPTSSSTDVTQMPTADDADLDEAIVLPTTVATETSAEATDTPASSGRFLGAPDAPITIVEYSDFQCPFCQRHHLETLPRLKQTFIETGRLRYEFRDFPIASLHPLAYRLHEATRCAEDAAGTEAFWQAHDLFFENVDAFQQTTRETMDAAILQAFDTNGLPDITNCLASDQFKAEVEADLAAGQQAGVSGTPAFFIEGYPISGAQPFELFAQAIEAAENDALAELFQPDPTPAPNLVPTPATVAVRNNTALGDPNAPVQIIEFSDYQCPFCQRHVLETMPHLQDLIDAGRVYYVFRDFPIAQIHPLAYKLHEAALCVRNTLGTDAFWQTHDWLFEQAETFNVTDAALMDQTIAAELSELDFWSPDIERCYVEREMANEVEQNVREGEQLGITGTPTFFLNGYPIVGAVPFEAFNYGIELAEEGRLAEAFRPRAQEPAAAPPAEPVSVPLAGDEPVKGSADAPVTIVEYSSYQCPFCKRHFEDTMPHIQPYIDDGTVRYIFKDFPLTTQPQAFKVHEAAHCAHEQGGDDLYWAFHNLMFETQAEWARQPLGPHIDTIKQLAATLSALDSTEFGTCLDSDRYAELVQAGVDEGIGLNVRGTPSFFINGRFVNGAQPFVIFQQAIEQALAEQ